MCFVRASESDSNDVLLERLTARVSRGESEWTVFSGEDVIDVDSRLTVEDAPLRSSIDRRRSISVNTIAFLRIFEKKCFSYIVKRHKTKKKKQKNWAFHETSISYGTLTGK
jgi:hypothetical protein